MQNFLTDSQFENFTDIAAMPGGNSHGGPGWRQLEAVLQLKVSDRSPVLQAFADEVHFRMSVDQRLAVAEAIACHLAQPAESHLCAH